MLFRSALIAQDVAKNSYQKLQAEVNTLQDSPLDLEHAKNLREKAAQLEQLHEQARTTLESFIKAPQKAQEKADAQEEIQQNLREKDVNLEKENEKKVEQTSDKIKQAIRLANEKGEELSESDFQISTSEGLFNIKTDENGNTRYFDSEGKDVTKGFYQYYPEIGRAHV